jgi:hypothetical protein
MWTLNSSRYNSLTDLIHRWSNNPADGLEGSIQAACLPLVAGIRGLVVTVEDEAALEDLDQDYEDLLPDDLPNLPAAPLPPGDPGLPPVPDPEDYVDEDGDFSNFIDNVPEID